jgi:hypothetical protein
VFTTRRPERWKYSGKFLRGVFSLFLRAKPVPLTVAAGARKPKPSHRRSIQPDGLRTQWTPATTSRFADVTVARLQGELFAMASHGWGNPPVRFAIHAVLAGEQELDAMIAVFTASMGWPG